MTPSTASGELRHSEPASARQGNGHGDSTRNSEQNGHDHGGRRSNGPRNGGNGARKGAGKIDTALARALLKKIFSEMGPILGPADESSELPLAGRKPNGHGPDSS